MPSKIMSARPVASATAVRKGPSPAAHRQRTALRIALTALMTTTALTAVAPLAVWADPPTVDGTQVEVSTPEDYTGVIVGDTQPGSELDVVTGGAVTTNFVLVGNYAGSAGTLTISGGGTVAATDDLVIANAAGATGTVTVSGAGSAVKAFNLKTGVSGSGELNVLDGASAEFDSGVFAGQYSGSSAALTVSGTGSKLSTSGTMLLGTSGDASLTVSDGGVVETDSGLTLGEYSGSTGTLFIGAAAGQTAAAAGTIEGADGAAAKIAFGSGSGTIVFNHTGTLDFDADVSGTGDIDVYAGTTILSGSVNIGSGTLTLEGGEVDVTGTTKFSRLQLGNSDGTEGTITVSGSAAKLTATSPAYVGLNGAGVLTINNGGHAAFNSGLYVGRNTEASGTVTISGAGSKLTAGDLVLVGVTGNGDMAVTDGGTVVVQNMGIAEFAKSSVGTVRVSGAGSSLTVAGTYTYQGLAVGDDGTATLLVSDSGTVSVASKLSVGESGGSQGTVTVTGAGSGLTVGGDIIFGRFSTGSGALTVSDGGAVSDSGDMMIGSAATSSGAVTVTGAGSTLQATGTITVGGEGTGSLTVADGGAVSDSGDMMIGSASTSGGAVTVTGTGSTLQTTGTVAVAGAGTGNLTVADGGTVRAGEIDLAQSSGSTGVLNIGAAAGETAAMAGTLDTGTVRFGAGAGVLALNHTGTYFFGPALVGDGTLDQIAGTTKLTGDASGFTGSTEISGGALYVNAALGGSVDVTGGTLGGSGTIAGPVSVGSGGTIAPGNSIGALHVGDITIGPGATYAAEVDSAGNSDLIAASGKATLTGGTLKIVPYPDFALGTSYTILTAAGGVTGTFDTVQLGTGTIFLTPVLSYGAGSISSTWEQTTRFAEVAATPNEQAVGTTLDGLGTGGALFYPIAELGTVAEARGAYDALSGEIYASAETALLEDSRFAREAATDRLRLAFGGVGGKSGGISQTSTEGGALWAQLFGDWGRSDGDGNAATLNRNTSGLFVGGDAEIAPDTYLGLMAGYARSSLDATDRQSSDGIHSYTLGVYAGKAWGGLSVKGGLAASWNDLNSARSVAFGSFSDALSASYASRMTQAYTEFAYDVRAGSARIEPFADIAHVHLQTDGIDESGGAAALAVSGQGRDATFTTLGARGEVPVTLGARSAVVTGSIGWQHAFGATPATTQSFGSGGAPFTVAGVPLARNVVVLNAGFRMALGRGAEIGIAYQGAFGSGVSDNGAQINLRIRF